METKETKSRKAKKDSIEIRFTVSETDGNLKGMLDKVPNGCYTDFTKQALRYYLKAVRDGETECDFLKPHALDDFKTELKPSEPCLEDILKVIQACSNNRVETVAPSVVASPIVNNIVTDAETKTERDEDKKEIEDTISSNDLEEDENDNRYSNLEIHTQNDEDTTGEIKESTQLEVNDNLFFC